MLHSYQENGFVTWPFPTDLRNKMLSWIETYIRSLAPSCKGSLDEVVKAIPDDVWAKKMSRSFRIFPKALADPAFDWAKESFCKQFGTKNSAVNVVLPHEVQENRQLNERNLAIYWRCVRPGKPDAGRPHRDASFWDLEFKEGYDPKIPFPFNYLIDCKKIWIPLSGCNPSTTLRVIPKSHKMNIPTTVEQTEYGRRPSISSDWLKEHQNQFISPIELSSGSCILFDMNLVHMGPRHEQSNLRISAEFNFISK